MGLLRFWLSVMWEACRGSIERAHVVLWLVIIGAGLAHKMIPAFLATWPRIGEALSNLESWKTATIVIGAVILARLIAAPYIMYRNARAEVTAARAEVTAGHVELEKVKAKYHTDKTKSEIREKLGQFIDRGNHLLVQFSSPASQQNSYDFDRWQDDVSLYLTAKLGPSYKARFVTPTPHAYDPSRPIWYAIRVRLDNLQEFSQEINSLTLKI